MPKLCKGAQGSVIQFEYYQREAARLRRRAWWAGLFSLRRPEQTARAKSMAAGSGAVVKFRKQAGAAGW